VVWFRHVELKHVGTDAVFERNGSSQTEGIKKARPINLSARLLREFGVKLRAIYSSLIPRFLRQLGVRLVVIVGLRLFLIFNTLIVI